MSIIRYNDIAEYWKTDMFYGHEDFINTMSRNNFREIRLKIIFHPSNSVDHKVKSQDPLWFCRKLLTMFQKNCSKTAVPLGTSALDENTTRTKART